MRTIAIAIMMTLLGVGSATAQPVPVCGNNVVEPSELCDDGNLVDGDGCDSNCTPTGCGNGIVTAGEQCDDGNTVSGDCCSATCMNENLPPDCSAATASVSELWPPNHKLVSVAILGVSDPDGDPLVVRTTGVTQDEPIDAAGSGATCPDAVGVGLDTVGLRSERSGQGDGRFYHVAFQATDRCNATCTGEVVVVVPHDQSPHKTPGDGGALYDSTLGAPPCEGASCGPTDCVPDPGDVHECDGADLPAAVTAKLAKAKTVLGRASHKARRVAAKLLDRAAKRIGKAGKRGDLPPACATALSASLEGGKTCAMCTGE